MSTIERMTITMPSDIAAGVKAAVAAGDYASTSEVVRDWKARRAVQLLEMGVLKADIDRGLADVAAGRVKAFDAQRIVERGRTLLANR